MTPYISVQTPRDLLDLPQPEPSAGSAAYHRERELALGSDPRRRENYKKYLATVRKGATVEYLPIKLDIENVSRCNFRCTMCVVSDWNRGRRAHDMSLDAFKALIDEQYGLIEIKLQGIGEPTLQGDDFFAMIRYARERHIWVRTTTNASLLHLNDNYRKLVDSGVNEIQISIDGADEETFVAIRRGAVFARVLENCRLINRYCREQGVTLTKMWTVVQRANAHQLEQVVELAAELGFPQHVLSLTLSDWGIESWSDRNAAAAVEDGLDIGRLAALEHQGAARGLQVRFWNVIEKYSTETPQSLCPWPFERAYISSDSRLVPCCYLGNPDVFEFPLESQGVADVWRGSDYTEFRRAHLEGRIPKICRGCYNNNADSNTI